ncbi:hypothetical protein BDW74DRAFT_182446 [Aspergillus multicolor]|uniref:uncharacterized protein n=1 Tax=Aspergillus multicolor TaxID=41759 RepID=UPI003CCD60C0
MSDIPCDQREHARDITINQDDPASSSGAYASDSHSRHQHSSNMLNKLDPRVDSEEKGGIEVVEREEGDV